MSQPETLALVQTLANQMASPTAIAAYYNDVAFELGAENWFTDAMLVPLQAGQREVDLEAVVAPQLVNKLGLIYDDTELEEITLSQLEALDPQWRDALRYTRSYVTEDENAKVVALHPAPFMASNPNLGSFGSPLGLDYPTYNLAFFYSYAANPPFDAPWYYLELPLALRVLALEFMRESDHTDQPFAQAAQGLYTLCKSLLA